MIVSTFSRYMTRKFSSAVASTFLGTFGLVLVVVQRRNIVTGPS